MTAYTFHSLSDADFEDLVCDLLQRLLNEPRLQRFSAGPDSGVDLLGGARATGNLVVQCKHYWRSRFSELKRSVARELPKLEKLQPRRYLLATSLGLTPGNKEELLTMLSPYCKGVDDIFGRDDLNTLLRRFSEVETSHYKPWLTSVPVLEKVLRHGAAVWNAMTMEEIERKMSLYVQTSAFDEALQILSKHNYCVLSGIPGVGKTTLAQVLVTRLLDDGYDLVAVRQDVSEALDGLERSTKTVVFYDDFLGQSSLAERLSKNEDHALVRLLREAKRSHSLKVVLTTREYILEDAKRVYEPLNRGEIDLGKCLVKVEDYTRASRARILYNHLYFSNLTTGQTWSLIKDRAYRRIVDHPNYNPRVVEWMTLGAAKDVTHESGYAEQFLQALDNPSEIWQHAFDNQLGPAERAILYGLGSIEGRLGMDELLQVWAALRHLPPDSSESGHAFRIALRQLDGSFVRSSRAQRGAIVVEFHNPSIKDYVRRRIARDIALRTELLRASTFFEQVTCLVQLSPEGKFTVKVGRLVSNDVNLHHAVARTFAAPAATYHSVHPNDRYTPPYLERDNVDLGRRLSAIAAWASEYGQRDLLSVAQALAAAMTSDDKIGRVATAESSDFMTALMASDDKGMRGLAGEFVEYINFSLDEGSTVEEWLGWTAFLKANPTALTDAEMETWAERAAAYCENEIDTLLDNVSSRSEAEGWYDQIKELASEWDVELDGGSRVDERIEELGRREEGPDDSGKWRGLGGTYRGEGGEDGAIDSLFHSLVEREKLP